MLGLPNYPQRSKAGIWRNPLAFPAGRKPGFDANHPAAKGISAGVGFSCVPMGTTVFDLLSSKPFTRTSTTANILSGLGPGVSFGGAGNATIANATGSLSAYTFSCFIQLTSVSTGPNIFVLDAAGGFATTVFLASGTGFLQVFLNGAVGSGIPLAVNVPYFIIVSVLSGSKVVFTVVNLSNGTVRNATVTTALVATAAVCYLSYTSTQLTGSIGPAMYSQAFVSAAQQLAWAQDPWSFWYPDPFNFDYVGASIGGAIAALALSGSRTYSFAGGTQKIAGSTSSTAQAEASGASRVAIAGLSRSFIATAARGLAAQRIAALSQSAIAAQARGAGAQRIAAQASARVSAAAISSGRLSIPALARSVAAAAARAASALRVAATAASNAETSSRGAGALRIAGASLARASVWASGFGGSVGLIFGLARSSIVAASRAAAGSLRVSGSAQGAADAGARASGAQRIAAQARSAAGGQVAAAGYLRLLANASRSAAAAVARTAGSLGIAGSARSATSVAATVAPGAQRLFGAAISAARAFAAGFGSGVASLLLFAGPRFGSYLPARSLASFLKVPAPPTMDIGEVAPVWVDFARLLQAGETITTISVTATNVPPGGAPVVTLLNLPTIGTAPAAVGGSGAANTAVLQEVQGASPGVTRVTATITTSLGNTYSGWTHQPVQTPN